MGAYDWVIQGRTTIFKVAAGVLGDYDPTEYLYNATTGLVKIRDWIDGVNGIQYAYDDAGRVTGITDYDGSVLSYTYDNSGNVASMNDYHGNVMTYAYDARNQMTSLTAPGSKIWNFSYNANGQPTQYTHPNGMLTAYGYDPLDNRLTNIDHKDGTTVMQGFAYAFDAAGNITSVTHEDDSYWTYSYDGKNRLSDAIRKDNLGVEEYREAYTYDAGDNMLTKAVTPAGQATVTTTHTVGTNNELLSMNDGTTTTSFTYDDWGRQTTKGDGTYTTTNGYRYGSMLASVANTDPGVDDVTYEYGGDGKRRSRSAGTDYAWYNWSGLQLISEEDAAGVLTNTHIHNPFRIWGSVLAEAPGANPATAALSYYTHDLRGSTTGVFDGAKNMVGAFEYNPYGDLYSQTAPEVLHMYTGQIWDPVAQLNLFALRSYSPLQSQWISREPTSLEGPNLYHYVYRNPVSNVDYMGANTFAGAAAGGAIGSAAGPVGTVAGVILGGLIGTALLLGGLIAFEMSKKRRNSNSDPGKSQEQLESIEKAQKVDPRGIESIKKQKQRDKHIRDRWDWLNPPDDESCL